MFVKCIAPFGDSVPGDVVEIPDGSSVAEAWFVPVEDVPPVTPPVTPPIVPPVTPPVA